MSQGIGGVLRSIVDASMRDGSCERAKDDDCGLQDGNSDEQSAATSVKMPHRGLWFAGSCGH